MAETVVVVAEYLAVMHHAREALARAGYHVVTSTNLTAGYGLARLYHPVALVLQPPIRETQLVAHTLTALRNDPATADLGVVLIGGEPEGWPRPALVVTAGALESGTLLQGVREFAAQAAARVGEVWPGA